MGETYKEYLQRKANEVFCQKCREVAEEAMNDGIPMMAKYMTYMADRGLGCQLSSRDRLLGFYLRYMARLNLWYRFSIFWYLLHPAKE